MLILAGFVLLGVIGYKAYKAYQEKKTEKATITASKAEANSPLIDTKYEIKAAETSTYDSSILMLRSYNIDGSITSYKYDPRDFNFLQNFAVEHGLYRIRDGVMQFA